MSVLGLSLKRRGKYPKGINETSFGAFRFRASRSAEEFERFLRCCKEWPLEFDPEWQMLIISAWRNLYTIRPVFEGQVEKVTGQHLRIQFEAGRSESQPRWLKNVVQQVDVLPMLIEVPDGMFVATYEYNDWMSRPPDGSIDFQELYFWAQIFRGYLFAKQFAKHWFWPSIVPNWESGFAVNHPLGPRLSEHNKRRISFVFADEPDALLFSAYMDTIKQDKLKLTW